ncbi:MAG: OmpA family protein [Saprospiraceae bacterium]|nr:OmpA family protein [Saprospiraceae bacterium]
MKQCFCPFIFLLFGFGPIVSAQSYQYFVLEKLPLFINSGYDEITPVPSRDGRTLYFTRVGYPEYNRTLLIDSVDMALKLTGEKYAASLADVYSQIAGSRIASPERAAFNQDIWIARGDSFDFTHLDHPGYPLNNALPNSMVTITPDPNAFYVINQFERNGNMDRGFSLVRRVPDSIGWSFPQPVEIKDYYTITSDVSLTMSFDGKVLILSARRADSRDMDLYVCFREGENKWSAPQHLGNVVNSDRRETTPYLSEDNETLFFSSNRANGYGGNDLYTVKRLDDTWKNWSSPALLFDPMNSKYDDSQPYFNMTSGYLYFTSKREGNSDIYRVRIAPPQATEHEVIGRVIHAKTRELIRGARINYGASGDTRNLLLAEDGTFRLKIPRGVKFELIPEKGGFSGRTEVILFRRDYYYFREHYVDLLLDPLEVNAKIELRPIFFQQSKAVILEDSYGELERLAVLLKEAPNLHIRIEGHTDNIGKVKDLYQLSEDRAKAIRDFLVGMGVSEGRIETIGHGPKFPLTDNSSEEMRANNRRVEIVITKI